MSSLIEKAAQRLEQLRKAGAPVDLPAVAQDARTTPLEAAASPVRARAPEAQPAEPEVSSRRVNIDLQALANQGFLTPFAERAAIADQFRVIKRPLLANAQGKGAAPVANGNLIMVTSAMPGEGKSFTAVNLAMSLAMELDYRVLLVDADVARPSLREVLNLPAGPGLLDVLMDPKVRMSDALLQTNVDKLSVMLSGTPQARATELLASDAMTRLVMEMGQRYSDRIIVFDSPPLLLTTEARVLATHMGQIVLVVEAERTLQSQVRAALSTIEACPVKLLVLNQARGGGEGAYGYGYGHGYGYSPDGSAANPAGANPPSAAGAQPVAA